jgi:ABC-type lipoprotein export system ATPase subunit
MTEISDPIVITVYPGRTKDGRSENFEPINIRLGDTISIVGPTGSGKTAFINDIEVFAQRDTITNRLVKVNGELPSEDLIRDPAHKPIAMITQNTKCLADLNVKDFLNMHAKTRNNLSEDIVSKVILLANQFTGEEITEDSKMSSLSGGQTRSLMISDAVLISNTPILLLDEIESAGIFKDRVITKLKELNKAVIFVTHDPYVSLLSDRRIVMKGGEVVSVLYPNEVEKEARDKIRDLDLVLFTVRERIRTGELIRSGSI